MARAGTRLLLLAGVRGTIHGRSSFWIHRSEAEKDELWEGEGFGMGFHLCDKMCGTHTRTHTQCAAQKRVGCVARTAAHPLCVCVGKVLTWA